MMHPNLLHVYLRLDPYTREHCTRVRSLSLAIGALLGLPKTELKTLAVAAQLHDLGKVSIDVAILQQRGPLSAAERRLVQQHPRIGAEIWRSFGGDAEIEAAIRFHHEHYNGGGYPEGLREEQIPLMSRVITVADALDAMLSDRPYSPRKDLQEALFNLLVESGQQFDPAIVSVLFRHLQRTWRISLPEISLAA